MDAILSDLRYAVRQILRRPLFAVVVGGSLAIGVGVNAALFGAVNVLLLRPVPGVDEPARVVEVGRTHMGRGFDTFAYPDFLDVREQVDERRRARVHGHRLRQRHDGVEDVKNTFITDVPGPMLYLPIPQVAELATQAVVRVPGGAASAAPALRGAILAADPTLSMTPVISLARAWGLGVLPQRVAAGITSVLGALALLLSALGVYGVVAYAVGRHTREMGGRLALPGILIGVPSSLALGFVLRAFLLGLSPFDPVALVAVPARRAAGVHPAAALRSE